MMIKNKKGISVLIGYIFLISVTVIISTIVFQQLKTYIPTEKLECPEGVSIFLKDVTYDCDNKELSLTLKNNGRFSIAGYFISATDSPEKELATIDLSKYTEFGVGGLVLFNFISEGLTENAFDLFPSQEVKNVFDLSSSQSARFYSLTILPIRYQEIDNRNRIVNCGGSRIEKTLTCTTACIPATNPGLSDICVGKECGPAINGTCRDVDCGTCNSGFFCDVSGQCISSTCVPAIDPSLSGVCEEKQCGTAINGTCGVVSCGIGECTITTLNIAMICGNSNCADSNKDVQMKDHMDLTLEHDVTTFSDNDQSWNPTDYDVIVISESVSSSNTAWLKNQAVGIFTLEGSNDDEFELGSSGSSGGGGSNEIDITDNSHYITEIFPTGEITVTTSTSNAGNIRGWANDVTKLAHYTSNSDFAKLLYVEKEGVLENGVNTAAERRVFFGARYFANLNSNGITIFDRSLDWAAYNTG